MKSKTRLQCVNCGLNIRRIKKLLIAEESENLRQLLSDWTCKELEDNDVVCGECYAFLHFGLENDNKSRRIGHKCVCLSCGKSLNNVRSKNLTNHPEHKCVIAQWVPSHQVKRIHNVCNPCWLRAHRTVTSKNKEKVKIKSEVHSNDEHIKMEPLESLGEGELDIPASPGTESETDMVPDIEPPPPTIPMATYRRAAATARRCMVQDCKKPERFKLPRVIIERLLIDYSFYVPSSACVCELHKQSSHKVWSDLYSNSKIVDFTVPHLENLFSVLINSKNDIYCRDNFEAIIESETDLCKYWLGVDYEVYAEMFKDIQRHKKQINCHKRGLAIYLMKKHTGFSHEKLGSFFKMPPAVIVKNINIVHEYLEKKAVSDIKYVATSTCPEEIVYYRI